MTSRSAPTSRGLSIRIGMPVRIDGPDHQHRVAEVALGHRASTARRAAARSRRRSRRRRRSKRQPAQRQQVRQRRAELIAGRLPHGGEPPVLGAATSSLGEHAEVGLGVADVDDQQHARGLSPRRQCAAAAPRGPPPGPSPSAVERIGQRLAVGQRQLRVELEQRHEHEPPRADLGVGQRQPRGAVARDRRAAARRRRSPADRGGRRRPRGPPPARPPCTRRAAPRVRARSRSAGRR